MATGDITFSSHGPDEAENAAEELADLYSRDFVDEPERSMEFYSKPRFLRRLLEDYVKAPNFRVVMARRDGALIGFIYGCSLPAGSPWWRDALSPLPDEMTRETGDRTLAVLDLLVARDARGHGTASRLHADLLSGRREERATLLSSPSPTRGPAYHIWQHWGYEKVAEVQPAPDSAVLHLFLRPLR